MAKLRQEPRLVFRNFVIDLPIGLMWLLDVLKLFNKAIRWSLCRLLTPIQEQEHWQLR
jgi:hypothetical protein